MRAVAMWHTFHCITIGHKKNRATVYSVYSTDTTSSAPGWLKCGTLSDDTVQARAINQLKSHPVETREITQTYIITILQFN